jgi:hypothetical protein
MKTSIFAATLLAIFGLSHTVNAVPPSGDASGAPLAFLGSSCGARPDWNADDAVKATIADDAGERVFLHQDFPEHCEQADRRASR